MAIQNDKRILGTATGFTIVEILVGMVIGLIAVVAMFQSYISFETNKRTIEATNSAQIESAFITTTMDRELRRAGYGFAHTTALGCATNFYASGTASIKRLVPALITNSAGSQSSDQIQIMTGNNQALTPLILAASTDSSLDNSGVITRKMKVKNTFGIRNGDFFVLTNVPGGVSFTEPATQRCTFGQATTSDGIGAVSAVNSIFSGPEIDRKYGTAPCPIGANTCDGGSPYNFPPTAPAGYTPLEYKTQVSGLLPLGILFDQTFFVSTTGQESVLRLTSGASGATSTTADIAVGVVNLQAQYGIDNNGDDVVDLWVEPTGSWASTAIQNTNQNASEIKNLWKIKAIRAAIVTRANLMEKNGSCPAYPSSLTITWPIGPTMTAPLPANPANICYRYNISKINVALKNVVWSSAGDS